jgi:predicted nuclease of predicted toxin-antitoxin system
MADRPRIKFFTDENVPDSVGRMLADAGHDVATLRDHLVRGSPDQVVAKFSELLVAVLVSLDRDFDSLAPRIGVGQRRFRRLSRISIKCDEPRAAERIKSALSLIEHEWQVAQTCSDQRMIVEVGTTHIRTIR